MPKTRPIAIKQADEPWMLVYLADGTVIRHRKIIIGALQLLNDDGTPIIDPSGMGQYALQAHDVQIIEHSPMIEERQIESVHLTKKVN